MKRFSYLLSTLLLLTLVVFSSCKDDTPDETLEEQKIRQLTAGAFTVDEVTLNPSTEFAYTAGSTIITFSDNNTFTMAGYDALPTFLSAPEGNFSSGTWSWTDTQNYDEVRLTSGDDVVDLTITSLDDNNLVFTYQGAEPKPIAEDEVTVTVTATR